jgi:hypothetical protein
MLSHQQPYLWQVMHLSAFLEPACYSFQRLLAVAAEHRAMMDYLIRTSYLHQGTPSMPWLPPVCFSLLWRWLRCFRPGPSLDGGLLLL